jgi:NAD+ synthase (glutamine-hydrolysing)
MQHLVEGNLEEKLNCASGTLMKYFKTRKQIVDNLEWAWERYNVEWKRAQTPPVFIASRRAFGFDRRDTIAPSHTSLEYERLVYLYLHAEDGNCRIGI